MRALFLLVFLVFLASRSLLSAAEFQFGPELPLSANASGAQTNVKVVTAREHILGLWNETEGLVGSLDGRRITISNNGAGWQFAAAAGSDQFLIVFTDQSDVFARRLRFDGTILDSAPILITTESGNPQFDAAVAHNGENFVVIWTSMNTRDLRGARISNLGILIDVNPILIAPAKTYTWSWFQLPHLVTVDGVLQASWEETYWIAIDPSKYQPPFRMYATRIDRNLRPLDSVMQPVFAERTFWGAQFSVTSFQNVVTFAWVGYTDDAQNLTDWCVRVGQMSGSGIVRESPIPVACRSDYPLVSNPATVEVAWNSSEYVVAWSDYLDNDRWYLHSTRLSPTLNSLDEAPFPFVSTATFLSVNPSIAQTPAGVVIGYAIHESSRTVAVTRTLDRLPPLPPRRRALTH
jgi:hypothetical protein